MRIYWLRLRFCLLTICLGVVLPGHLFADGGAVESEAPIIRIAEPGEPWEMDVAAGRDDDIPGGACEPIGLGVLEPHPRSCVFRGNWFDITQDAVVTEFGFYLLIPQDAPVTLYFSCHEEIPGGRGWGYFQRCSSMPNDIELNVLLTTDPEIRFYSTGEMETPIALEAGKSYVLGVAWGDVTLVYARDRGIAPPKLFPNFPNGIWRGSVSLGLDPQTEPPLVDPEDGTDMSWSTSGGPWIMEICLAGACCLGAGGCEDMLEADCQDVGDFTCPGLTCDRLAAQHLGCPLVEGACCVEGDECVFDCLETDKFSCVGCNGLGGVGGTWNRGIPCSVEDPFLNPCLCKGACCLSDIDGDGMCSDGITEDACLDVCGHYGGRDTTCDTVEPRCTVGACCVAVDDCLLRKPEDCSVLGGDFLGFGVACDPNPCIPSGACCVGDICSELTEDECQSAGGNYRGDKMTCDRLAVVCGKGACCHEDHGCVDTNGVGMPEDTCVNTIGGVFQGDGTSCVTLDPPCPGVCCSWECYDDPPVDPVTCVEILVGWFPGYGVKCSDDPAPCPTTDTQACCLPTGACTETTQIICETDLLGTFILGETCSNWDCPTLPRTGACCMVVPPEGDCDDTLTEDECLAVPGRLYQGDGVKCTQVDCTRGPCCLLDGTCVDTIGSVCTELCGYLDTEPDCTTADCSAGACCLLDESCATYTLAACESLLGFHHEGEECVDVDCERGACCLPGELCDFVCGFLTEDDCTAQGGVYRGNDTECIPHACEQGACCTGNGTCADVDGSDCQGFGGYFEPWVTCASAGCGACCLQGECDDLTLQGCADAGRQHAGAGEPCVLGLCTLGACCLLTGECEDNHVGFQCGNANGDFYSDFISCQNNCIARGACCAGGVCSIKTLDDCVVLPGDYVGTGRLCEPNPCTSEVVSSDPPNCAIDARQPHAPGNAENKLGWEWLEITFDRDPLALDDPFDFNVEQIPADSPPPPYITDVDNTVGGNAVMLQLSEPINPDNWTCFALVSDSSQRVCLGYLPADVGGDGEAAAEDVSMLIGCLNGTASCEIWQCDVDRDDECGPTDILRAIDLLNGAAEFGAWLDESLLTCPSE